MRTHEPLVRGPVHTAKERVAGGPQQESIGDQIGSARFVQDSTTMTKLFVLAMNRGMSWSHLLTSLVRCRMLLVGCLRGRAWRMERTPFNSGDLW